MTQLTFHLILHTHWDREWYLPRAGFLARLVPAVDELLALLERDPDLRFVLDGQTALTRDYLAVHPGQRERLEAAVRRAQLEVGPWYVLGDELMPSGESLVRNLLIGTADAASLGSRMNVVYSPDAFGHPGCMPMLAAEFGIDAAVVWRGLAPRGGERDLYRWRGPDGSEVHLYHLPPAGYEIGIDLVHDTATNWGAIRDSLVARSAMSHVAVFIGADHHAPPAEPQRLLNLLRELEPQHLVRWSSLQDFFEAVAPARTTPPVVTGELRASYGYTWTLQGVHATRARLRRRHDAAQLRLQRCAEPLVALALATARDDQQGLLRAAWRALVESQFHDTLAGCCSDAVAREQAVRLDGVDAISSELIRRSMHHFAGHDADRHSATSGDTPQLVVWNPAARIRELVQTAELTFFRGDVAVGPPSARQPRSGEGYRAFALVDDAGRPYPVQVLDVRHGVERSDGQHRYPDLDLVDRVRIAFAAPPISGLSLARFALRAGAVAVPETGLDATPERLANRYIEAHCDESGRIALHDRRTGEQYHDILQLVDERDRGDTYTPSIESGSALPAVPTRRPAQLIADGPLVAALQRSISIAAPDRGSVAGRLVVVMHADSPLLRVRVELDNRARDHRLRICIPVGTGDDALAGTAFGFVRRPHLADAVDECAEQRPGTAPAHRYVAVGTGDRGLAVICPGFFEYEWTADHDLFLTLWRSTGEALAQHAAGATGTCRLAAAGAGRAGAWRTRHRVRRRAAW